MVDSPNREAYRADQALVFVALKDDAEEGLVVVVVGREILEFVEHDTLGGGVAVDAPLPSRVGLGVLLRGALQKDLPFLLRRELPLPAPPCRFSTSRPPDR